MAARVWGRMQGCRRRVRETGRAVDQNGQSTEIGGELAVVDVMQML